MAFYITFTGCLVTNYANKTNKHDAFFFYHLWLRVFFFFFIKPTRIGADLVTCGTWTFSGMCPVLKKRLLLIICWTLSFSLNFSTLRDLHKGSRTWAGEAKKFRDYLFCYFFLLVCSHNNYFKMFPEVTVCSIWPAFHQFNHCHNFFIWNNCWLCVFTEMMSYKAWPLFSTAF